MYTCTSAYVHTCILDDGTIGIFPVDFPTKDYTLKRDVEFHQKIYRTDHFSRFFGCNLFIFGMDSFWVAGDGMTKIVPG